MNKIEKPNVSWLMFSLCILLMLMLVLPQMFQRAPIYDLLNIEKSLPYELNIYGQIFSSKNIPVNVCIGGYKTTVDESGKYSIDFLSDSKDLVIVCLMDDKQNILNYSAITFSKNEWSKEINLYLE